jgi:hypothetical protein
MQLSDYNFTSVSPYEKRASSLTLLKTPQIGQNSPCTSVSSCSNFRSISNDRYWTSTTEIIIIGLIELSRL